MAGHPDLPKNVQALLLRKADIFDSLRKIDNAEKARDRILAMENDFREKIGMVTSRVRVRHPVDIV